MLKLQFLNHVEFPQAQLQGSDIKSGLNVAFVGLATIWNIWTSFQLFLFHWLPAIFFNNKAGDRCFLMCILQYCFFGQLSLELKEKKGSISISILFRTKTTVQNVLPEWMLESVDVSSSLDVPKLFRSDLPVNKHRLTISLKCENKLPVHWIQVVSIAHKQP